LDAREIDIRLPADAEIFRFSTASRSALGITQPWIQWVTGTISRGPELLQLTTCNNVYLSAWFMKNMSIILTEKGKNKCIMS